MSYITEGYEVKWDHASEVLRGEWYKGGQIKFECELDPNIDQQC